MSTTYYIAFCKDNQITIEVTEVIKETLYKVSAYADTLDGVMEIIVPVKAKDLMKEAMGEISGHTVVRAEFNFSSELLDLGFKATPNGTAYSKTL